MPLLADRVRETTTTVGTGTLVLGGAPAGFQPFNTAFANGATVYYAIQGGAEWEIGIGTVGIGTLERTTILQSSNGDAVVSLSAGSKDVFCTYVADRAVTTSDAATLTNKTLDDYTNNIGANSTHFRIKATGTISKGTVVKATGYNPGENAIEVAVVTSATDLVLGISEQVLTAGQFGLAVVIGELFDVNTNGFTVGNIIYSNGSGGFTETKPSSGLYQALGWIVRANASNGVIAVNIVAPLYVEASTNTANTIMLRDGSGNFSAGVATLSGLSVDSPTLVVDAANNRVGVGTAAPTNSLDVAGSARVRSELILDGVTKRYRIYSSSSDELFFARDTSAGVFEAVPLRIDVSGNLGIAVTPSAWGAASKGIELGRIGSAIHGTISSGAINIFANAYADGTNFVYANTGAAARYQVNPSSGAHAWFNAPSGTAGAAITFAQAMTLDASGNLSLGLTGNLAYSGLNLTMKSGQGYAGINVSATEARFFNSWDTTSIPMTFYLGGTERMRLEGSGNLAVDTNTLYVDAVNNNVGIGTASPTTILQGSFSSSSTGLAIAGAIPTLALYDSSGTTGTGMLVQFNADTFLFNKEAGSIVLGTSNVERARLDASGNLGLGVTPSASSAKTLQFPDGVTVSNAGTAASFAHNAVFNSGWKYVGTGAATLYQKYLGAHNWYTAPSGTAGNAISFTQGMTLDASGNLGVGISSSIGARVHAYSGTAMAQLTVDGVGAIKTGINFANGGTTYGQIYFDNNAPYDMSVFQQYSTGSLRFGTNNTERARIDASGNFSVDTNTLFVDATNNRVGIGTATPAALLHVESGNIRLQGAAGGAGSFGRLEWQNTLAYSSTARAYIEARRTNASDNGVLDFATSVTTNAAPVVGMTLDNWGNLGLGVTPSAWSVVGPVLQVKNAAFYGYDNQARVTANAYFDGSAFRYIASAFASEYRQTSGQHQWLTAPSGTAGNAITFTQAMTLDANGSLGIGTASPISKLDVRDGYITSGSVFGTNGSKLLAAYYSTGHVATWGAEYSNGGPMMGYAVWPSTSEPNAFVSSTSINVPRGAYVIEGATHKWFAGGQQTVTIDGAVSTERVMTLLGGDLYLGGTASTTTPSLSRAIYLQNATANSTIGYSMFINAGSFLRGSMFLDDANDLFGWDVTYSSASPAYAWRIATGEKMRLDVNGNLLVGTTGNIYGAANRGLIEINGSNDSVLGLKVNNAGKFYMQAFANNAYIVASGIPMQLETQTNQPIQFATNGGIRLTLDGTGRVGLGAFATYPWHSNYQPIDFTYGTIASENATYGQTILTCNAYNDSPSSAATWKRKFSTAATLYIQSSGTHYWYSSPNGDAGTAIGWQQNLTLTQAGNLLIGASVDSNARLTIMGGGLASSSGLHASYNNGVSSGRLVSNAQSLGVLNTYLDDSTLEISSGTTNTVTSGIVLTGGGAGAVNPSLVRFYTASAERARITSAGYFKASNSGVYSGATGLYHELRKTENDGDWAVVITHSGATATNQYGTRVDLTGDPNNTGNEFLLCRGNLTLRASLRSNGGLANYQSNNADLSDARTKTDITPAVSMWSKIGALEIVTYKYTDQTHDDVNVGVIAQQVETVEPVWVDADGFGETPADGVPLKTVYTKDITFAAIKALQEAMARIETLEQRMAALEA